MTEPSLRISTSYTDTERYTQERISVIKNKINARLRDFTLDKKRHADLQSFVGEAHKILLSPDAKRIRSIIPAFIADEMSFDEETCRNYGLVVELLHYTSLIHDDVIDNDHVRRGCRTLNHMFANSQAVLIGDFLMCAVIDYSLGFMNSGAVIKLLVETIKNMVTGLIIEQTVIINNPTLEKYKEMALLKTSSLFQLSFGLPFVTTAKQADAMQCGVFFGYLFQIYDDYLDRDKDPQGQNIFHILSEGEIMSFWEDNYRELMVYSEKVGVENVVRDVIAYLQGVGYFNPVTAPGGTLFEV